MERKQIITSNKNTFMQFLIHDDNNKISELLNEEGIEILSNSPIVEERISYILNYSKFCNELFKQDNFLNLFLNTDISYYYASLQSLNDDTYEYIINKCLEKKKNNYFIAKLFSYFKKDSKEQFIENWKYSKELLYEIFKCDLKSVGPTIMKFHDIDLMSNNINIPLLFEVGKEIYIQNIKLRNENEKCIPTLDIPSSKITNELAKYLWDNNNVFKYRAIINDAQYVCDPSILNEYAKKREDQIIKNSKEQGLIYPFSKIQSLLIQLFELNEESYKYYELRREIMLLCEKEKNFKPEKLFNKPNYEQALKYLEKLNNEAISNYIVDYHFEENYYNIMYDLRELLNYYYSGNISISNERLNLYTKISHIDELLPEDKIELHEQLKNYNVIEMFYDDMSFARQTVYNSIKNYSLTKEMMEKYKSEELSKQYGVNVYNIDDDYFFALVKSGSSSLDRFPTGHSFSLIGNGCIGTLGDSDIEPTFVYDADSLRSEQIVHTFPMDSFTLYKPFVSPNQPTKRIHTLMSPEEFLECTYGYNELLILEQGKDNTDIDEKIPRLQKMALYCLDKITDEDVKRAQINGVGILLINSHNYKIETTLTSNINRHQDIYYWDYNYFDGKKEEEKHYSKR